MEEIPVGSIDGGGASKSGGSFSDKCDAILKDARQYIKSKLGIPYDFVIHTMLVVENKLVKCTSRFDTIVCQLVHMKYCWTKIFWCYFPVFGWLAFSSFFYLAKMNTTKTDFFHAWGTTGNGVLLNCIILFTIGVGFSRENFYLLHLVSLEDTVEKS